MKPSHVPTDLKIIKDKRFRHLVGTHAWKALPKTVRERFGHRLTGGASVVYQGRVTAMRMSLVGRLLAQLARLVGGPLPYDSSCVDQPAVVAVTEDCACSGQFWIRQYGRATGFPQVIHSSKRFSGPTGVEEYIGRGIGIALRVRTDHKGIYFESDHYFLKLGSVTFRLPSWLQPGSLTIAHQDLGNAQFLFSLNLSSDLFGELIQQDALFHDT
ncbi:DUF4166 domain-containing protein [Ruegeria sp. EL01]|jgi:hypothetical protein|uniref:DUF4166 domain-containing protein n=1 Tax=Ruegeria sp. EL01 TaxID=2107578 RepID=UPI000EA7FB5E|nr:DUF4166 domain-containing protein [Ruegeria sp. EL01]